MIHHHAHIGYSPRDPNFRPRLRQGTATAAAAAFSPLTAGIGAGVALASSAVSDWMNSIRLSHDADTATTLIVNGLAAQLANLDTAYFDAPPSCATQRAALDAYDQAWLWLQSAAACGNPNFGSAGNRCISDRAPGGKYPWAAYYRDPIANDPRLSAAGCDTSQELILPSLTTGTYAPTGITASGNPDATQPAGTAVPGQAATPAAPAQATISPTLLIVLAALGVILIIK
jgi:hypothetical protein